MKKILFLSFFLLSATLVFSQEATDANGTTVKIRSGITLSKSKPLYIIDGYKMDSTSTLMNMNPEDIISMDVRKDAESIEKYGDKNTAGVIVITTKNANTRKWKKILSENGSKIE